MARSQWDVAASVDRAQRRRRWGRLAAAVGLPLAAVAIALGPAVLSEAACSYGVAREGQAVPELVGRDLGAAEAELAGGCLRLDVQRRWVPAAAPGTVVAQDPRPPAWTVSRTVTVVVAGTRDDPPWRPAPVGMIELAPGQPPGDGGDGTAVLVDDLPTVPGP